MKHLASLALAFIAASAHATFSQDYRVSAVPPHPAGQYLLVIVRDGRIALSQYLPESSTCVAAALAHRAVIRSEHGTGTIHCMAASVWRDA